MKRGLLAVLLCGFLATGAIGQMTPEEAQRKLQEDQRRASGAPDLSKLDAASLRQMAEGLHAKLATAEKKLAAAEKERDRLKAQTAALETRLTSLGAERETLAAELEKWKPMNSLAGADGPPIVTAAQIATMGDKYAGQRVRLVRCRFASATNTFIDHLPAEDRKKAVGLTFWDDAGTYFELAFVYKDVLGELVGNLKLDTRINVIGTVERMDRPTSGGGGRVISSGDMYRSIASAAVAGSSSSSPVRYGLVVTKVERVDTRIAPTTKPETR